MRIIYLVLINYLQLYTNAKLYTDIGQGVYGNFYYKNIIYKVEEVLEDKEETLST